MDQLHHSKKLNDQRGIMVVRSSGQERRGSGRGGGLGREAAEGGGREGGIHKQVALGPGE